jgi:Protein of unknown function, DUF488
MTRRTADIQIKRVYDPPDKADGTRVLVDRLWPRGLRKEKAAVNFGSRRSRRARNCVNGSATIRRAARSSAAATAPNWRAMTGPSHNSPLYRSSVP